VAVLGVTQMALLRMAQFGCFTYNRGGSITCNTGWLFYEWFGVACLQLTGWQYYLYHCVAVLRMVQCVRFTVNIGW